MSDLDDIYYALMSAKSDNDWLYRKVTGADAYDAVRGSRGEIERGIAALERLRGQLRNGAKHIEPPDDYKLTSCGCGHPGAAPPCSWCTNGKEREAEEAINSKGAEG